MNADERKSVFAYPRSSAFIRGQSSLAILPDRRALRFPGSTPSAAGSGNRPVQLAHSQKKAVLELSRPETAPMVRGLHFWDATPAPAIESIIVDHDSVSMVANTRPRNSSETCRSSCDMFSTELTAMAAREIARNSSASENSASG